MRVLFVRVGVMIPRLGFVLRVRVCRAFVDAKFHPLDALPLLPLEVHVKVADVDLAERPFQRRRLHSEVAQRAHHHVAADAGDAVEKENFHV